MKDYPTRMYDILEHVRGTRFLSAVPADFSEQTQQLRNIEKSVSELATKKLLPSARLMFAPGDLAPRVYESEPAVIVGGQIRIPFENIFLEFASPFKLSLADDQALVYGLHLCRAPESIWSQMDVSQPVANDLLVVTLWMRRAPKDDGTWYSMNTLYCPEMISQICDGTILLTTGRMKGYAATAYHLKILSFILFLNSSNVTYERRTGPKMEKKHDRYWWKKDYENDYDVLQVKAIPKRIALSLRKNEAGIERQTPFHVKGHFKVFSHCGQCDRRRAIRRFLFKEKCLCGVVLDPGVAKTKMFWWDDFWTGPDVGRKVALA